MSSTKSVHESKTDSEAHPVDDVRAPGSGQRKLYPNTGLGPTEADFDRFDEGLYELMEAHYGKPTTPYPNKKPKK